MKKNKTVLKKIVLASFLGAIAIGGGFYWYFQSPRFYTYDKARDGAFTLDIFKHDWSLLTNAFPEYTPEYASYLLDNRAASILPKDRGRTTIKVLYKGSEPIGFISYYKKNFYTGKIFITGVLREARGRGYGEKLVRHAIDDLASHGCTKVRLVTRRDNIPAQKLYARIGFKLRPEKKDNEFLHLEYSVQ